MKRATYNSLLRQRNGMPKNGRAGYILPLRRLRSTLLTHHVASVPVVRRPEPPPAAEPPAPNAEELQRQAELERDLQMARDIQQGLLLAAVPYLRGWELSAVSTPARDLGGDLYDFLSLHDGWHAIMIGDVSGKGLPAALRMAVARTVFRHAARQGNAPAPTLAAVNYGVCDDIPQGMVTMLYIMLHPEDGMLRIANAGHTYPLFLDKTVSELELPGMPLGVDPDIDYEEIMVELAPGQSVFLYTDGVTEASNPDAEMFGDRLQALLAANSQYKPRALMRLLLRELRTWSAEGAQDDDITMVILRRRFDQLSAELRTVMDDVLEPARAATFWEEHLLGPYGERLQTLSPDDWDGLLPELTKAARASFNRGLARELVQQLRLVIEEYRGGDAE